MKLEKIIYLTLFSIASGCAHNLYEGSQPQDRAHIPETGSPKNIPLLFNGLPEGIAREGYAGEVVETKSHE